MIPLGLLRAVLVVEGAAIFLVVTLYLLLGYRNTRYEKTTGPLLDDLRREVMRVLITPEGVRELVWKLKKLPVRLQTRVFLSLAPSLAGTQRMVLVDLATEIGLVADASERCGSRRWYRRLEGARLLTALGSDAPVVGTLFDDPHDLVRSQAAEWAQDHANEDRIGKLIAMLHDPALICRYSAREGLLGIGEATVAPFLEHVNALSDDDTPQEVVQVIIGLASAKLLVPTVRFANHIDPALRALAAQALGAIGAASGIEILTGLLNDEHPDTRSEAARALGVLGHWPAGPRLAKLLSDHEFEVRREAGMALKAMGAPGEVLLRNISRGSHRQASDMAKHVMDTPGVVPAGRLLA